MELEKLLNREQIEGVTTTAQYVKVVAGAGSGKTRVLTYRIAYLISERYVHPYSILGITFTNKAAKEIKTRVQNLVSCGEYMHLSTIHSWCARFLRKNASEISYPNTFTILDEDDQVAVIKNIFHDLGYSKTDPKVKECLNWICSKKTEGIQYRDIKDNHYPNPEINFFLKIFGIYTDILEKIYSLDFDDLLLKTIQILEENIDLRRATANMFTHILVDEFQDINDVQFYLIRLLMNERTSLYVVGDPDQTIYTWRGANNKIMLNLEDNLRADYPSCKVEKIMLVNNYRSSKKILDASNKLIRNNRERIEKDLIAINPEGEDITFYNAITSKEEASFVVSTIYEAVKSGKNKYTDFAILYRSNYLTRELESQFALRRIPYKIFGGLKFYQRREIKDVLAYITLLVNPDNDIVFDRIINVPKRNIGPTSLEKIKQKASESGQSVYLFCKESLSEIDLPSSKKNALRGMINLIEGVRLVIEENPTSEYSKIIKKMLDDLGYFKYLEELDDVDRDENVLELLSTIQYFFQDNPTGTMADFIENATLQASSDEVESGDYVALMTVHIAKGLEFNSVFVYSLNEGVFPNRRALDERNSQKALEEERRLAYVAMTRARKKLYLTSNNDFSPVLGTSSKPSRFISEAGLKTKYESSQYNSRRYENNYINPYLKSSYKPQQQNVVKPALTSTTNCVKSWRVGDRLIHESFGIGTVRKVPSDKLIEVEFENREYGVKTLLSSHVKIKKLYN